MGPEGTRWPGIGRVRINPWSYRCTRNRGTYLHGRSDQHHDVNPRERFVIGLIRAEGSASWTDLLRSTRRSLLFLFLGPREDTFSPPNLMVRGMGQIGTVLALL